MKKLLICAFLFLAGCEQPTAPAPIAPSEFVVTADPVSYSQGGGSISISKVKDIKTGKLYAVFTFRQTFDTAAISVVELPDEK